MSSLREEIVASQKLRSDLYKWKLIIVSALGAAGLGFTEHGEHAGFRYAYLVLVLIPFVCFYVDLLCKHVSIRIMVIGTFIRLGFCGVETAYEGFVVKTREKLNVFVLEDWALQGSTTVLSSLIMFGGLLFLVIPEMEPGSVAIGRISVPMRYVVALMFTGSGLAGVILSLVAEWLYKRRMKAVSELAEAQGLVEELGSIIARSTPCPKTLASHSEQA